MKGYIPFNLVDKGTGFLEVFGYLEELPFVVVNQVRVGKIFVEHSIGEHEIYEFNSSRPTHRT